ncbi:uncharacterized protein LOC111627153 [Centruroides sculpturatus]|uniref:uncharacterized protein LOC111627153 n=1 Tax=Centruroides sculpturatus TaxID=218467 RepID=UPI000C6CC247|nr:uncharacterized protein LOC111627153 [Centruroides sculpturatus]
MNQDYLQVDSYLERFEQALIGTKVNYALAVNYTLLKKIRRSGVEGLKTFAQNVSEFDDGPYTGETSALMLSSLGIEGAIIGHSERRQYFGETDLIVRKKLKQLLAHRLKPIVCVGETLLQRQQDQTEKVIGEQLGTIFAKFKKFDDIIIAYEPLWAIGTGQTATPEQAQKVARLIRKLTAKNVTILYGGSVNAANVASFLTQPDIDGVLVGNASLDPKGFAELIREAERA